MFILFFLGSTLHSFNYHGLESVHRCIVQLRGREFWGPTELYPQELEGFQGGSQDSQNYEDLQTGQDCQIVQVHHQSEGTQI